MATLFDVLKSENAYPIPATMLEGYALKRGLNLHQEATGELLKSEAYNLCLADMLLWLSEAPNIVQGGIEYTFDDDQREKLRKRSKALYIGYGGDIDDTDVVYGYKGSLL